MSFRELQPPVVKCGVTSPDIWIFATAIPDWRPPIVTECSHGYSSVEGTDDSDKPTLGIAIEFERAIGPFDLGSQEELMSDKHAPEIPRFLQRAL